MTDLERSICEIRALIDRSSLGVREVRLLRAKTPVAVVEMIVARTELSDTRGVFGALAHKSLHHNTEPVDQEFRQGMVPAGKPAASAAGQPEHPDTGDRAEARQNGGSRSYPRIAGGRVSQADQPVPLQPARPLTTMSDDLKNRGPADRARVNVNEPWEVAYWTKALGCTEADLRDCTRQSVMVEDVRRCLEQKKRK